MKIFPICLLLLFFVFTTGAFSDNWEMLNNNAYSNVPTLTNTNFNFDKNQKYDIGRFYDSNNTTPNIVVSDDVAYILNYKNQIISVDLINHKILSKVDLPKIYRGLTPKGIAFYQGYLYITFLEGMVVSYSTNTQEVLWDKELLTSITSAPIIEEGKMYIVTYSSIYSIDTTVGTVIWNIPVSNNSVQMQYLFAPNIYSDELLVGLSTSDVIFLKKDTGELISRQSSDTADSLLSNVVNSQANLITDIKAPIRVVDNHIAIIFRASNVIGYDFVKKSVLWSLNIPAIYVAPALLDNTHLIFTSYTGQIYCINPLTGDTYWNKSMNTKKNSKLANTLWFSPFLVNDNILQMNSMGEVFTISLKDGSILKYNNVYSSEVETISSPPVVLQNYVLLLSNYGNLYQITSQNK